MTVWEPYLPALTDRCLVLRYDLPGHGASPADLLRVPEPGRTTVAELASQVLSLVQHLGEDRFHYAGISLGGAIGAHLAIHHPGSVTSLALICSSAHFGAPRLWEERAALVRRQGTRPLLATSPDRWFADPATSETPFGRALLQKLADADPVGHAACCDALATYDLRAELAGITAPTLVMGRLPRHRHAAEPRKGTRQRHSGSHAQDGGRRAPRGRGPPTRGAGADRPTCTA
jgi:pimeloyl-ACP methyl ester carboxylesterase